MNEHLNALVGARITEFRRKMAAVKKTMRSLPKRTVTTVTVVTKEAEKRIELFQNRIHRLANSIRAFGTVLGNMGMGSLLIASPSMVPILAASAGLIGSLGPMIGVLAGSTFALATAFGFAGSAAVGFGAAAIPTISKLFDENEKLNKSQQAARSEFDKFKKTWNGITKDLEEPVLKAFGSAMKSANKMLKMARPLFDGAATAMNNLLSALNKSLDSPPVQAFFDYMNKNGGPMLEKLGKAAGNFLQGFMSMMTAFGPLAESTLQGFLNMSKGFAEWAAGLSKSEKFQSFVNYVNENMPKLRAIFRDVTAGLVYMFSAFGPLASEMMTGLQNMMARFKEWGKTLSDNQQFQSFIDYIRTNGPTVVSLIGNITTFLVNLGIAIAPIGAKVLELVNSFIGWTSSMMEAHPWFGKLVAVGTMMAGAFMMILPLIIKIRTAFAGLPAVIITLITKALPIFTMFKTNLIVGLKMLGTQFYLLGTKVMAAATTLITWFGKMIASAATWVAQTVAHIARVIAQYAVLAAKAAVHAAKVALTFTVTMVKAAATATASMVASMAKIIAKYAVLATKSMVHAAKVAASWVVAMGPVGWVIATIVGLVALVIANWDKIKSWTTKTWNKIWGTIKDIVQKIWDKVTDIFNNIVDFFGGIDLYASGKAIIQSAIDGILAVKDKILGTVEDIVSNVRDFWPFSPAKVGPLSDIHRMDFAGPIDKSIARARKPISSSMEKLAGLARNAFTPQLALADVGATAYVDTSMTEGTQAIEHAFNSDVDDFELPEKDIIIQMNDREVGRGTFRHIREFMNRDKEDRERFN